MDRIRDNKKLMILIIMGIIAVIAAVVIIKPFSGDDNVVGNTRTVVYSLEDIPIGATISEDMLELKEVDSDSDVGAFQYTEDVVGKEVIVEIAEGSAINEENVEGDSIADIQEIDMANDSDLSSKVPEGLRAVLMPTGPVHEIVNYLKVGDRIDLLITHSKGDGQETVTPFQNVEVLLLGEASMSYPEPNPEVEGEEEPVPYSSESLNSSSVILAMTPKQAETISNMRITGLLETAQITLRNFEDEKIEKLDGFGQDNFEDWRNR